MSRIHSERERSVAPTRCALCERQLPLTWHHLIPRKLHRKPAFRKRYGLVRMRGDQVPLCRPCHDAVHRFHDEATLGRELNTLDKLRADPAVDRHVQWARRQRVRSPN